MQSSEGQFCAMLHALFHQDQLSQIDPQLEN